MLEWPYLFYEYINKINKQISFLNERLWRELCSKISIRYMSGWTPHPPEEHGWEIGYSTFNTNIC